MDRILAQICTASTQANMNHLLRQMQYRFAVIYETLSSYTYVFVLGLMTKALLLGTSCIQAPPLFLCGLDECSYQPGSTVYSCNISKYLATD